MISMFLYVIDFFSLWLFRASFLATAVMVCAIGFEVWSRYVLGAPTLWAFDITYMANGTILIFAAAWTLRGDAHVRVDILDNRLGAIWRNRLDGIFFTFAAAPVIAMLSWYAVRRGYRSYLTSEVEMVSPWQPLIWPFQLILAVGLVVLTLQCVARGLRAFAGEKPSFINQNGIQ